MIIISVTIAIAILVAILLALNAARSNGKHYKELQTSIRSSFKARFYNQEILIISFDFKKPYQGGHKGHLNMVFALYLS